MRSGTNSFRSAPADAAGWAGGWGIGTETDETCEEGVPEPMAAAAAWTANPATLTQAAATAAALRAARRRSWDTTMYKTI
jgi:hypothetical protein